MLYSDIKQIRELVGDDWRDTIEQMRASDDVWQDQYRLIHQDAIDEIMKEELSSDTYVLGCFNASFIAMITGAPQEAIEKMQAADAYDGLGHWLLEHIDDVQREYAAADGYGHHFAHYDGNEIEIGDWYAFRT